MTLIVNRRKRIAITMRQVTEPRFGEVRDAISLDWVNYLSANWPDMILLPLPNRPELVDGWAEALDIEAALLTNGNDWGSAPERDETETRLVNWCRRRNRPVLGACRGMQAINAMFGGSIDPDIKCAAGQSHAGVTHQITLSDPVFADMADARFLQVNSYHDQGVTRSGLASDLHPFAMAGEVVEGCHHRSEAILAIQWHPERPDGPTAFDRRLIDRFLSQGAFWAAN